MESPAPRVRLHALISVPSRHCQACGAGDLVTISAGFDFTGRDVLVVGTSRGGGIDPAIAAGFAGCCALDHITGAEPESAAQDQGRYPYTQLDVADSDAVSCLVDAVPALNLLVNCVGFARRDEEYDSAVSARVLDVNPGGVLHLANAFRKHLVARRGSLINISSMYSVFDSPPVPAYGTSKAGAAQLTKSLALAWAGQGVRVNAVAPASIVTEQSARGRADPIQPGWCGWGKCRKREAAQVAKTVYKMGALVGAAAAEGAVQATGDDTAFRVFSCPAAHVTRSGGFGPGGRKSRREHALRVGPGQPDQP